MIEKTFTGANEYTAPVFLPAGKSLVISISGTFVATLDVQRLVKKAGDSSYPAHGDAGWHTAVAYAEPLETGVDDGDSCWYRILCSAYTSGSPAVKIKVS